MNTKVTVKVIGAGLAGVEAAWQIANRGIDVVLCEMKPVKYSAAHSKDYFAELVCSNSLKAERIENACGLLKEEMRRLNSIVIEAADYAKVPAGGALAVDRDIFSEYITAKIKAHPHITVVCGEVSEICKDELTIVATGPLTSDALIKAISGLTGEEYMYFYDAAAPVVTAESINMDKVFKAARYDRGTADYINAPMTEDEYDAFYTELINAQTAPLKEFENRKVFEGCMPVEVMAKRGRQTLTFGPLKPVGLINPKTGRDDAYAVVQLRQDNKSATLYNIVGFQTNLKWGEQKRVFSMIPGLENAEFVRYGVMHRNTFINSPKLLNKYYQMRRYENIFFAGQITGVEGYVESASSGLLAGINAAMKVLGRPMFEPSGKTSIGSLPLYISDESIVKFQPMNSNFGIIEGWHERVKGNKTVKYALIAERALKLIDEQAQKLRIQA